MALYQNQILSVTGSEPVSVTEAKEWALIDTAAEDTLIGAMITTARQKAELYLSRDIVAKTRKYLVEYSEDGEIELPWGPIDTITNVTYTEDNVTATLDTDYKIRGLVDKRIDMVNYPAHWVTVSYSTVGIDSQDIKDAIKGVFEALYNSRGIISLEEMQKFVLTDYCKSLLIGHKKMFI